MPPNGVVFYAKRVPKAQPAAAAKRECCHCCVPQCLSILVNLTIHAANRAK